MVFNTFTGMHQDMHNVSTVSHVQVEAMRCIGP